MLREGIALPKTPLTKEAYMSLSPQNRLRYIESLVRGTIHLNKGITASQICKALDLSYASVKRHLDALEARGECYKVKYGESHVYFHNGVNLHPEIQKILEEKGTRFEFSFLRNDFGRFFYIQEKIKDPDGKYRAKGALMIPIGLLEKFYLTSQKIIREYIKKEDMNGNNQPELP